MSVAFAAPAAGGDNDALALGLEVADELAGGRLPDDRAHRNVNHAVNAAPPVTVAAHTMLATAACVLLLIAQIKKGCKLGVGLHDHVAAMPTIAATGAAAGNKFFPPKGHTAPAAVPGDDANPGFVDKFHDYKAEIREPRD